MQNQDLPTQRVGHAESVEEAARRAAKEVLREFSAQNPDVVELRETIGATLAAVRQLETATMERISSLAASMQSLSIVSSPTGVCLITFITGTQACTLRYVNWQTRHLALDILLCWLDIHQARHSMSCSLLDHPPWDYQPIPCCIN